MEDRTPELLLLLGKLFGLIVTPRWALVLHWIVFWIVLALEAAAGIWFAFRLVRSDGFLRNRRWRKSAAIASSTFLVLVFNLLMNVLVFSFLISRIVDD